MVITGRFFTPPPQSFFLFGPRGTGKSTWLKRTYPDALWVDLLAPETARAYSARPERLRELIAGAPEAQVVVLDEVQRVPPLLDVVHEQIEAGHGRRFVLSGSSARKLRRSGVNLLAGRAVQRAMHPFLAAELGDAFDLDEALQTGLVPLVWDAADRRATLATYLALYIREEVQQEGLVRDVGTFSRFLEAASLSHAQPMNTAAIARECEASRKTVVGYLEILHDLLLCFTVPVFTRRARRQLVAHPKLYWFDAGVFRSARPAGPLDEPGSILGAGLEGLVGQHLRAWIDYGQRDLQLYYWRTRAGTEVDFVLYGRDGFFAVEVKGGARVRSEDLRGLRAFGDDYPEATRVLLYRGNERLQNDGVACLPLDAFLRALAPDRDLLHPE